MKITITIDCDNAAFGETPSGIKAEARRILRDVAELRGVEDAIRVAERTGEPVSWPLPRDINGNEVGSVTVSP